PTSSGIESGMGNSIRALASACSASPPWGQAAMPIMRAPTGTSTPSPTSTTRPHSSAPGVSGSGGFSWYWPRHSRSSKKLSPVAAPGWLWPFWAERQLDPESPSFVARGESPALTNVTHRNWTLVGNLASPGRAAVDPRGLVTPWAGGWSLDWWIGAEDRWHLP